MWTTLLIVAATVLIGIAFVVGIVTSDGFGLAVIGGFAMVAWEFPILPVLAIGGFNVHLEDFPLAAFIVALAFRKPEQLRALRVFWACWLLLIATFAFSLYRGQQIYGPQPAINEMRVFAYLLVTMAWVATIAPERATILLFKWARVIGWLLTALSIYHIIRFGVGSADDFIVNANGDTLSGRSLFSGQALLLAAAGFISAYQAVGRRTTPRLTEVVVFLGAAFLSQNRSVWVAGGVGLFVFVAMNRRSRGQLLILGALAAISITLLLVFTGGGSLVDDIKHSATSQGTYNGREQAWTTLIDSSREEGLVVELLGSPFGSGYMRVNSAGAIEAYAPHNQYVTVYLRAGLIGLLAFLALIVGSLSAASKRPDRSITVTLILMVAVYAWVYQISWYVAPLAGWALLRAVQPLASCTADGKRLAPIAATDESPRALF